MADLYWRATTAKDRPDNAGGAVLHGAPLLLVECRKHWIAKLPKNFIRVNPADAAYVNLAFGRIETSWGPLGVWILGHEDATESESRNLRLCLLRLHAEQEVLDLVLGSLANGTLEYRASAPEGDRLEAYLNKATRVIYRNRSGSVEQSAMLAAFDAADATEYRAIRVQLAERLKGARRQVVRKIELFERRNYVRAERFIQVEPGATYSERTIQMTDNRTITVGPGATINAPLVIADHIEHSFNNLKDASLNPDVKALVTDLLRQISEAAKAMPPKEAKQMGSDAESLSKEIAGDTPRRKWYELSIEGLRDAAKAVGDIGKPILETTATLLPLLQSLFP